MNYQELDISIDPLIPFREIAVAKLAEIGFESFEDSEHGLKAYIPEDQFDESTVEVVLKELSELCELSHSQKLIEQVNWNAEWEKEYQPVVVSPRCRIRALFHEPSDDYEFELIIQPQMSFGTGHHPTTLLMMEHLLESEVSGQRVLDLGTGTGVLAILAEKMGAVDILATDIEDYIVGNARDNVRHNACVNIRVDNAELAHTKPGKYQTILANINLNTLIQGLDTILSFASEGGQIFLSGFYATDAPKLIQQCESRGLRFVQQKTKDNWAAVSLSYSGA